VHDLTAARIWGIIRELAASGLVPLGDKGYIGEDTIRTPYRGRNKPAAQKDLTSAKLVRTSFGAADLGEGVAEVIG
jgi:hypothetical protein